MKLSIIIPLYNVEKHVTVCIHSILNQDLDSKDYEILIINDGSTDNSLNVVKKFEQKYSNIIVYTQKNEGVGSARNKGVSLAKGKYVYFLDPDDYLAENVLKTVVYHADLHKVDVLTFISKGTTSSNKNKSKTENRSSLKINTVSSGIEYIGENIFKNEVWWYIINREFLEISKVCFIQGRWMEDAIFTASLLIKANKVAYLPLDAHRHLKVAGSAMTSKEPGHYLKVIYDNANAAIAYNALIQNLNLNENMHVNALKRLRTRQQSFVFFMMIRMLKSIITKKEIMPLIHDMKKCGAYPLNSLAGDDYNGFIYVILTRLFNQRYLYYVLFVIINPFLKKIYK